MRHLAPLWLCVCARLARGGAGPRAGADMTVVLVTGGETTPTQAEIFDPATGTSCSLPDLPDPRSRDWCWLVAISSLVQVGPHPGRPAAVWRLRVRAGG